MKNAVAVVALLLSVGGIFVSLAREEMRCYLGLANDCGVQERTTSPQPNTEAAKEPEQESVSSPSRVERTRDTHDTHSEKVPRRTQSENPSETPQTEVKAIDKTTEPSEKPIGKETAQKSLVEPFKIQPIEVIPPPEVQSESQPIEVIPPPEDQPQ
ncbi:hypothetical protein [Chroococcus sp. FPU101]|uniref:hypothetical protein n=1 Tax=Chroococcus sp. FPU101 TaxID=1974212 RepID=UPI001A8CD952|nr:hypothetical protein [Chroococcus sp. FPU101]